MNFSRHQKQHLRQVMRNLANLLSAAGREWRNVEIRGDCPLPHYVHLPQSRTPGAHFLKETGRLLDQDPRGCAPMRDPILEVLQPSLQDRNQSQPILLLWPRLPGRSQSLQTPWPQPIGHPIPAPQTLLQRTVLYTPPNLCKQISAQPSLQEPMAASAYWPRPLRVRMPPSGVSVALPLQEPTTQALQHPYSPAPLVGNQSLSYHLSPNKNQS